MSIWMAISLALIATCCYQVGTVMQKLGAERMPRIGLSGGQRHVVRAFVRSPLWLGGLAVSIAGWVLFLKAVANAPVSIIQPVLGFGLCILALFSVVFLRERLRPAEWIGIASMVGGIVLLGISGAHEQGRAAVSLPAVAGISAAMLAILGGTVRVAQSGERLPLPIVLGFASGALIGLAALYTKALFVSLADGAALVAWTVFLPLTLLANVSALWIMQAGFQRGRALIVMAMNVVTNKIVAIICGVVTLNEQLPADTMLAAARVAGFVVIIAGTAILARFGSVSGTGTGTAEAV